MWHVDVPKFHGTVISEELLDQSNSLEMLFDRFTENCQYLVSFWRLAC